MDGVVDDGAGAAADGRIQGYGDVGGGETGRAHTDAGAADHAAAGVVGDDGADAGHSVHGDLGGVGGDDAPFNGVFGEAADAVAAHCALGAVGVEHPHFEVGDVGVHNQDEAVAAHAEVAVADGAGEGAPVARRHCAGVHIDIVVAGAVHFGEFHRRGHRNSRGGGGSWPAGLGGLLAAGGPRRRWGQL